MTTIFRARSLLKSTWLGHSGVFNISLLLYFSPNGYICKEIALIIPSFPANKPNLKHGWNFAGISTSTWFHIGLRRVEAHRENVVVTGTQGLTWVDGSVITDETSDFITWDEGYFSSTRAHSPRPAAVQGNISEYHGSSYLFLEIRSSYRQASKQASNKSWLFSESKHCCNNQQSYATGQVSWITETTQVKKRGPRNVLLLQLSVLSLWSRNLCCSVLLANGLWFMSFAESEAWSLSTKQQYICKIGSSKLRSIVMTSIAFAKQVIWNFRCYLIPEKNRTVIIDSKG